jgi:alpha-galactosidase
VVVGAGSASFGIATLGGLLRTPGLRGLDLRLVDLDEHKARVLERLARRASDELGAAARVSATTDRCEALDEADFVIVAVASDREHQWRLDRELALEHGITHYAENGGPGSFAHTVRSLDLVLPIVRDVEERAPGATVLAFTNPLRRVCAAIRRTTALPVIGLCHGIAHGYAIVAAALHRELGLELDADLRFEWRDDRLATFAALTEAARRRFALTAAGINHFTWALGLRDLATGEDALPRLHAAMRRLPPTFEPLTQALTGTYGLIPVQGDTHIGENVGFVADARSNAWQRYDIQMYDFERAGRRRAEDLAWMEAAADGRESLDRMRTARSERAEDVIDAIVNHRLTTEEALDIPNDGAVENLPEGAIVEVPALVGAEGVNGVRVGRLPEPIAELCHRQLTIDELTVEACLTGDRELVRQVFTLDPMVGDLDLAIRLADAYLARVEGIGRFA